MNLTRQAQAIEDICEVCLPEPLDGKSLDAFFVETISVRNPHQPIRKRIIDALNSNSAKLLFCGHIGCGKSTELNKLLSEEEGRFLSVKFSVYKEMSPISIRAEDILLVMAKEVLKSAKLAQLCLIEAMLKPAIDFFSQATGRSATVQATDYYAYLSDILEQLCYEIRMEGKGHRINSLRRRSAELLDNTNRIIAAVKQAIHSAQNLLIIVEDMDRLNIVQARDIFIGHVNMMTGIQSRVIYTAPVFLCYLPDADIAYDIYDDVVILPVVRVTDGMGNPVPGFDAVKKIIMKRLHYTLIETYALYLLVKNTGGILHQTFEALNIAARMRDAKPPLDDHHIRYALARLRRKFWQQITLPYYAMPGCPHSVYELYDRLTDYGKRQKEGIKNPPIPDYINHILLKSGALLEYGDDDTFGVHPLVIENLKDIGRL